jgi:hypothetical protein
LASAVGACNVEKIDATSGILGWKETLARLETGWETREERLPAESFSSSQEGEQPCIV